MLYSLRHQLAAGICLGALSLTTPGATARVLFDNGSVNTVDTTVNDFIDVLDGPGGAPTTVIFEPGANITGEDNDDNSVWAVDSSRIVINGGAFAQDLTAFDDVIVTINGGRLGDDVFLQDDARATMTGGEVVENVLLFDDSSFNLTGGRVGDDVEANWDSSFTMTGGSIGNNLSAFDGGVVEVLGGSVENDVQSIGFASVTIRGGSIASDIEASGNGTIDIFGGDLLGEGLETGIGSGGRSVVTLYGPEFEIDGDPVAFGSISQTSGTLSGTLSDGSTFSLPFERIEESRFVGPPLWFVQEIGDIVLVEQAIVPEPASLSLVIIGAGVLLARRRERE